MKAISIRQPFAEDIASGRKTLELRPWQTDYRGPLLIVASLTVDAFEMRQREVPPIEVETRYVLGRAVAIVSLVGTRLVVPARDAKAACLTPSRAAYWPFALVLEGARRFKEPFQIRGALGIFEAPFDIMGRESLLR